MGRGQLQHDMQDEGPVRKYPDIPISDDITTKKSKRRYKILKNKY